MLKNLKIRAKLITGFGLVLVMMTVLIISGISSLVSTQAQVLKYVNFTLPTTNVVWQMRRDLVSIQRYMLMALSETTQENIQKNLDSVMSEGERLKTNLAFCQASTEIDKTKIDSATTAMNLLAPIRQQISSLLQLGTTEANREAYDLFRDSYKPGVDQLAITLEQLGEDQNIMAAKQKDTSQFAYMSALILMISFAVIAVVITIIVVVLITASIVKPVNEIRNAAKQLSSGDLSATIGYTGKDELGQLSTDIGNLVKTIVAVIIDLRYGLAELAKGNFVIKSQNEDIYVGDFSALHTSMAHIIENLSKTLSQINQASEQVSSGSDQVSSGAQALSQGATEQASSVEELAATINEVSQHINENASNASQASKKAAKVGAEVTESNVRMQDMLRAMTDISSSSAKIQKIIKTIEDIAFQTNILALNAAVEAARAGAAGKGFAVVADEVRNLASKSAEASKSTAALIDNSLCAVENGMQIATDTATALGIVVSGVQEVATTIDKISTASEEQAQSISQITAGIEQISAVVQTNSATAEESAAASEELFSQSNLLKSLVSQFRLADVPNSTLALQ